MSLMVLCTARVLQAPVLLDQTEVLQPQQLVPLSPRVLCFPALLKLCYLMRSGEVCDIHCFDYIWHNY